MNRVFSKMPQKLPVRTVQIECTVAGPARPTYCIGGVAQRKGDRSRCPLDQAREHERNEKARIIEGSELTEML
jgi:hypothetical protein